MKYEDVVPRTANRYTVKGLKLGTEYEIIVVAINAHGENEVKMNNMRAMTSAVRPSTDESTEELPFLIIIIVCVIGVFLLTLNILLIVFFIRRRRKKFDKESSDSASQANTVEMVNTPMFVDDMMYTPYDQRSVDDIDDYKPPHNPSDELSPFFSTTEPFYPASYYFNHAPPSRYPVGSNISPDDGHPAWKPPAHRGATGSSLRSSLPPPPDQVDEDDYRKQLRKMQRSMSPGSVQQLQPAAPQHRENARPPTPPPPLPSSHSRDTSTTHAGPSDESRYPPPAYDKAYSSLPTTRPAPYVPPEMRDAWASSCDHVLFTLT